MNRLSTERLFVRAFDSLGDYHDFWTFVQMNAPTDLTYSFVKEPIDQVQALADAFDSLHQGLHLTKKKLLEDRHFRVVEELLRMAYEFYSADERKHGIQAMQEAEGLIWPSRRIRLNLAAKAERRAFGDVVAFADAKPPRFEGETSIDRLGAGQRSLFDEAVLRTRQAIEQGQETCQFFLVCTSEGIAEIKKTSQKKTLEEIRRLVSCAEIAACARVELVFLGVLVLDLEEAQQPLVSARAKLEGRKIQEFRFFLDDPKIFPLGDA
ncbi:hypothetical protein ACSFA8_02925 [Variovorax sp. RT4R15]|uniref:hypothetical protein n=1 Tax=Variovorax sp. RT4R15 TaxID=3443737 RepID=UPI003F455184